MKRIRVKEARLTWSDGEEVALWGTNYYIAHAGTYAACLREGLDPKRVAREDFADLRRLGVELIRLHLFEDDFTTREGDLVENEHLDLLDYTLHLCAEHGMYFFLCPVAWWKGTRVHNREGGFRNRFSNKAMIFHEDAIAAQRRYVAQLLEHRNPYRDNLRYAEDPLIAGIEIRNEPEYVDFTRLNLARGGFPSTPSPSGNAFRRLTLDEAAAPPPAGDEKATHAIHQEEALYLYAKWSSWCAEKNLRPDRQNYLEFTRNLIADYIASMGTTVRDKGYGGPIFYAYFGAWTVPGLAEILAGIDGFDGITFNCYAQVTSESPRLFEENPILNLAEMDMSALTTTLRDYPKAVYECDASFESGIMFPAMALKLREAGAQMTGQWRYSPRFLGPHGAGHTVHFLNLAYTPREAAAFRIAREVFREQPLYESLGQLAEDLLPGNNPYLWPKQRPPRLFLQDVIDVGHLTLLPRADTAVWRRAGRFFHSNTTTMALGNGKRPEHIFASGSSPYVRVMDDAIYEIELSRNTGTLYLAPRLTRIRDPRTGNEELKNRPAGLLSDTPREFDFSGLQLKNLKIRTNDGEPWAPARDDRFRLPPGHYELEFE